MSRIEQRTSRSVIARACFLCSLVVYLMFLYINNPKLLSATSKGVKPRGDERLLWDFKWFSLVDAIEWPERA